MTWELDPDNRPHPSDFSEEMRQEHYYHWCKDNGYDPDEQSSAWAYEVWFDEQDYDNTRLFR